MFPGAGRRHPPSTMAPMVLAHQGGWDEILFALIPLVVVALLLLLANKRANAVARLRDDAGRANDPAVGPNREHPTAPGDGA